MLTYSLEERGDLPLYDYLSRRIKEDIWAGVLKPGRSCPPSGLWPGTWRCR